MVAISKAALTLATLLLAVSTGSSDASPASDNLERRASAPSVSAPSGWKVSWNKAGRLSNGSSSKFIGSFTVDSTATSVTNAHVKTCVARCSNTAKCGFVNLLKMTGSKQGNVVCMMFPQYIGSKEAKYTTGPQSSGGKVNYSYGIRSTCTPTNGKAQTCTPAKISTTTAAPPPPTTTAAPPPPPPTTTAAPPPPTTTTTSTTTSTTTTLSPIQTGPSGPWTYPTDRTLPAPPSGATLIEWAACSGSSLSNPAMANSGFLGGSLARSAYIVQHGAGSDFDAYFSSLYAVVGDNYPLISPGFLTDNGVSPYYRAGINMGFYSGGDSWVDGYDDTTGAGCSSFDQYDAIINYLSSNSARFPLLQTIYFVGHSGGGNMIGRFSTINTNKPVEIRYVVANAANQAYFTHSRPVKNDSCTPAFVYPYQWDGAYPRYVGSRVQSLSGGDMSTLFNKWSAQSIAFLAGDQDTDTGGTQMCMSVNQGGAYRRNRNYAFWAYQNILAGTTTDVSAFSGYQAMIDDGAVALNGGAPTFNHQQCTVAGVGHNADGMFQSDCGRAAIFGQTLPAGAGASYPAGYPN